MSSNILSVSNLSISFPSSKGIIKVVDDISFAVKKSQIVGIVGESGSGKTQTVLSLLKLLHPKAICHSNGIFIGGRDISPLSEKEMCRVRQRNFNDFSRANDELKTQFYYW